MPPEFHGWSLSKWDVKGEPSTSDLLPLKQGGKDQPGGAFHFLRKTYSMKH